MVLLNVVLLVFISVTVIITLLVSSSPCVFFHLEQIVQTSLLHSYLLSSSTLSVIVSGIFCLCIKHHTSSIFLSINLFILFTSLLQLSSLLCSQSSPHTSSLLCPLPFSLEKWSPCPMGINLPCPGKSSHIAGFVTEA